MKKFHCRSVLSIMLCMAFVIAGSHAHGQTQVYEPEINQAGKDVIWVPTALELVETMLDLAQVSSDDYLIDLGSGDGGIVIAAAKRGAKALGIEYNPDLVEYSKQAAAKAGVSDKAAFEKADIFESDFSQATVISLFLLPELNLRLRPQILDLKPGTRIVSNSFDMGDWLPDQTIVLPEVDPSWHTAYFWIVPAKVDGTWKTDTGQITFTQQFQEVAGTLEIEGKKMEIVGRLSGPVLTFSTGGTYYTGMVSSNAISGIRSDGESWKATR